jgi:hypothetical protein
MIDSIGGASPLNYGKLDAAEITKVVTQGQEQEAENALNIVKAGLEVEQTVSNFENAEDILAQLLN